jgi:hypothetical protein
MKKITLLLLFCALSFINMLGQSDFREGYYITLENDTVYGLIANFNENRNSKTCTFKLNKDAEILKFGPLDIKAYRFTDGKFYISKKSKSKMKKRKSFLLNFYLKGIASLYFYNDIKGEHYLLETKDEKLYELSNEEKELYIEGKGKYLVKSNKHIGLLKAALADCLKFRPILKKPNLPINH